MQPDTRGEERSEDFAHTGAARVLASIGYDVQRIRGILWIEQPQGLDDGIQEGRVTANDFLQVLGILTNSLKQASDCLDTLAETDLLNYPI